MTIITGRNEVVAKVMFLQLCVILFTGVSASVHAGMPPCQGDPPKEASPLPRKPPQEGGTPHKEAPPSPKKEAPPQEGDPPRRRHPPEGDPPKMEAPPKKEAHLQEGGTPPRRMHPPKQEAQPPPHSPKKQTQAYSQWAAGTHPTGMHSCGYVLRKEDRC